MYELSGKQKLWNWFGLSYASFLTLPRVLMHHMNDEWQGKMADLLREYDETFPNVYEQNISVSVTFKSEGKFIKPPNWAINYRYPDFDKIKEFKGE